MNCSIKRNAMISLRLVLAALIGSLVLVCFAQPQAPEVSIEIVTIDDAEYVRLNWEEVEGAEAYNIYSSSEAYPEDWGEPVATVGEEVTEYTMEDSVDELGRIYYFHITAYAEAIPDWLVLVDGDLFKGEVTIDPFYISKYQVTQEEYLELMPLPPGDPGFPPFIPPTPDGFGFPDNPTHPAERVTWFDAIEYCNRLSISEGFTPAYNYEDDDRDYGTNPDDWPDGWNEEDENHTNVSCDWEANGYRLPTEAEWNHAANGAVYDPEDHHGNPYSYAGSDNIDEVAWYEDNSRRTTHPVSELAPNGLGIYDMSGNVFEWVWDIHGNRFPSGGDNPRGVEEGRTRVKRGGGWNSPSIECAVFNWLNDSRATVRSDDVGFRISRSIP